MNLKKILAYKNEIVEIAKKLEFTGLHIHNAGTGSMYVDDDGNYPLGLVATGGSIVNNAECSSRIGLLLGCKVDLVTENPAGNHCFCLKSSVAIDDEELEVKLIELFASPLEEVKFTALEGVDKYIAQGHIKEKDSRAILFKGPQMPPQPASSQTQQVDVFAVELSEDFEVFLQQHLKKVPEEARELLLHKFEEQIYPQAKKRCLFGSPGGHPELPQAGVV